jgi:uncharacterized heparinase superfamily protein
MQWLEKTLAGLRCGWMYQLTLRGPLADHIPHQLDDPRPRALDEADGYFRGRFRFAGHLVEAKDGSVFDCVLPSPEFAAALHGFEWLRHLALAGGDTARELATALTEQWLARNQRYSVPAWRPEITGARLLNLFAHGRFIIVGCEPVFRSRFFVSLRDQSRILGRTWRRAPEGLPRLYAVAGLAVTGLSIGDARMSASGLTAVAREIEKQILPDGGHISRSPEQQLEAFRVLLLVQQTLDLCGRETQPALRSAIDRMAPMVRFFRLGDGGVATFNGGRESDGRYIDALLESVDAPGKPFGHAPHCGYQRLATGKAIVVLDVGTPPPGAFATAAHAGALSFEMSTGAQRLIVNCGTALNDDEEWNAALRATPAHSTLTLADSSSAVILPPGHLRRLLGPRLLATGTVETRRHESAEGLQVDASHDLYLQQFGLVHQRRLVLARHGRSLSGIDRLSVTARGPGRKRKTAFAIRFHIHPDIRLSLAQGGGSVILKLPNGEGWRFRCGGGSLSVEESVYLGGGVLRRTEQLVVAGHIRDEDVECAWLLEQVGAG